MRLSARTVVLSFESSPAFASPERWFAGFFAAVAGAAALLRVMLLPDPFFAFWFVFLLLLCDEDELPIRSLIMSLTSSASAYLRR